MISVCEMHVELILWPFISSICDPIIPYALRSFSHSVPGIKYGVWILVKYIQIHLTNLQQIDITCQVHWTMRGTIYTLYYKASTQ